MTVSFNQKVHNLADITFFEKENNWRLRLDCLVTVIDKQVIDLLNQNLLKEDYIVAVQGNLHVIIPEKEEEEDK